MNAIAFHDLTGTYQGLPVLGPVSFDIQRGEIVALVGQSGAGKSTLLSLLQQRLCQESAYVPQDLGLVQTLSVFHNVYIGQLDRHSVWTNLKTLIHPSKKLIAEIAPILEALSLQDKIWTPVGELSGGQKQRAGIARALYQQQTFLIADEPVSALDLPLAKRALDLLCGQYQSGVIALHDVDLALAYSQRIIGLKEGKIVLDDKTDNISQNQIMRLY